MITPEKNRVVPAELSEDETKSVEDTENKVLTGIEYNEAIKYIDSLPPNQATVIRMKYLDEYTLKEIYDEYDEDNFRLMLLFMVCLIIVALWVYQNALKSKLSAPAWGIITLFTNIAGVLVYLIYKHINDVCGYCGAVQYADTNGIDY